MSCPPSIERLDRGEWRLVGFLFLLALSLHAASSVAAARDAGIPLSHLAIFLDGHLYLEIAKSFPLPYAAEGRDYAGQAPGFPALIFLGRVLVPDAWANWGLVALLVSWVSASLAAVAFYLLCKQVGSAPFWPSLLFIVANPLWASAGSFASSEAPAVLLAIFGLLAHLQRRPGLSAACLAAAVLTRFPSLILAIPIAYGVFFVQRDRRMRMPLLLAVPGLALALLHVYLALRIPEFPGVWAVHSVFWVTQASWPFTSLWQNWGGAWPQQFVMIRELTYVSLAFYLVAMVIGLRPSERQLRVLPVWVAAVVLFHVSLSGWQGAVAFTRLVVVAWPAALLIVWRFVEFSSRARRAAVVVGAVTALYSFWFVHAEAILFVRMQTRHHTFLAETAGRLDSDDPHWIDFTRRLGERIKDLDRKEAPLSPR